jgi:phenylacetic acid degradation operon negative regulatory protein
MQQIVSEWFRSTWEASPPRSKSLVITLFGDAVAPHGGAIRLGDLISVLACFGVNERLVRTCAFRLINDGWLVAERHGRRSVYSLTPQGMVRFQRAYKRVYLEQQRQWDGSWTLICVPPGPHTGSLQERLERELAWEGFGKIAPNVFGHPSPELASLRELLDGLELANRVFILSSRSLDVLATLPLRELVNRSWNLDGLANGYHAFAQRFALFGESNKIGTLAPAEAFIVRTLLIHWFRRVTLHDPQIPAELLPDDWPGHYAHELCHRIYQAIYREAEHFLSQTVEASGGSLPQISPWFYQRFGGLT